MTHFLNKLWSTTKIVTTLFCARMFGEYVHSGYHGYHDYARYRYRGKEWMIPTSDVKE